MHEMNALWVNSAAGKYMMETVRLASRDCATFASEPSLCSIKIQQPTFPTSCSGSWIRTSGRDMHVLARRYLVISRIAMDPMPTRNKRGVLVLDRFEMSM